MIPLSNVSQPETLSLNLYWMEKIEIPGSWMAMPYILVSVILYNHPPTEVLNTQMRRCPALRRIYSTNRRGFRNEKWLETKQGDG